MEFLRAPHVSYRLRNKWDFIKCIRIFFFSWSLHNQRNLWYRGVLGDPLMGFQGRYSRRSYQWYNVRQGGNFLNLFDIINKKASLQQSTSLDNKIKYITVFCQSKQLNKIPPEAENFSICSTLSIKKCLSSFITIYDTVVGCRNKNNKVVWNPSVFGVQTIWHIIFLAYNIFQKEFAI